MNSGRVRKPITGGVAEVPVIMQLEALECGAACLAMVMAYYGKWIPLEKVRADCGVSRDGSSASNIVKAAQFYGLKTEAFTAEPGELQKTFAFPCIIHWNFNHFVVLDGFRNNKAYLNDPARGAYSVDMKTFDESFTGVCICLEPGESFEPSGKPKNVVSFIRKRISGFEGPLLLITAAGALLAACGIVRPSMDRVFLDSLLTGEKPEWAVKFFVLLTVIAVVETVVTLIKSVFGIRLSGKVDAVGSSSYMWKVLHLPMEFFSQRMAGDIQQRQQSNAVIADIMIGTLAPLLIDGVMLILYLAVMFRYSWKLAITGLTALLLNIIIARIVSKKRLNITRVSMKETAKLGSTTVSGLEMMSTIKANGAEDSFFAKWSGHLANVNAERVKFNRANLLGLLPQFVLDAANALILFLGAWLVMKGEFTVGSILTFQGLMSGFMAPAIRSVNAGEMLQEMTADMERIDDVMEYPSEKVFSYEQPETYGKLSGKLEVKDLVFGYSKLNKPIVDGISFSLEPGRSVALVGDSGCGKSTIARLLTGLYRPWSGEILYDGKHLNEIYGPVFQGSVAMVDQEIMLFEDPVGDNIKMWDKSIEDFEMILAARDARIYNDIMERPEGFRCRLRENGKNFSGGQCQRMEIARVLAQDPTLIILDEATSALDSKTEYEVVRAIHDRGISCVVVAHRLSTVRSCDEIIVMEGGKAVGRGTHDELMKTCAKYRELVSVD